MNSGPALLARSADLATVYDDEFYRLQASPLQSARLFLAHLWQFHSSDSVLDIGCGRGAWLLASRELGARMLHGIDGAWNSSAQLLDETIRFTAADLDDDFSVPRGVDLALSLEVAEHLDPASSKRFVAKLTEASDAVMFGAACPGQGGTHHVNEQPQSYWARLFAERGYVAFDLFRPAFWSEPRVSPWYVQNTFLYLRPGCAAFERVTAAGVHVVDDVALMDCVHPRILEERVRTLSGFRSHARQLLPSFVRALRSRL